MCGLERESLARALGLGLDSAGFIVQGVIQNLQQFHNDINITNITNSINSRNSKNSNSRIGKVAMLRPKKSSRLVFSKKFLSLATVLVE